MLLRCQWNVCRGLWHDRSLSFHWTTRLVCPYPLTSLKRPAIAAVRCWAFFPVHEILWLPTRPRPCGVGRSAGGGSSGSIRRLTRPNGVS